MDEVCNEENSMTSYTKQRSLFPEHKAVGAAKNIARSGTFVDNMKLPIHRWFRYSAGFSAQWAELEIEKRKRSDGLNVLDPFAGSGTTLLAASSDGVSSLGFESHPFIFRVARAKSNWNIDPDELLFRSEKLIESAKERLKIKYENNSPLLEKCFDDDSFQKLEAIRLAFCEEFDV